MANTREELLNDKLDYLYNTKRIFKDVLEEQGVEISDEDTFRDYADKIRTLNNGDVLLFETEQEMRDYENPKEGVLAVVYQSYSESMSMSDYMRYIIFPEEVTLSQECINNYSTSIRNQKGNYVGSAYLTPESFYFYVSDVVSIQVDYTSTDGINYTRVENITNPVDVINPIQLNVYWSEAEWFKPFIKYESGYFGGLFKCIDGIFINVINQFSLTASNQILTGYSAYGSTGLITGDGTYITNMRTNEYVNKYLPNINDNTFTAGIIQYGTTVKPMEYVQRRQIKSDDAFDTQFPSADCVVQLADTRDVTVENTSANKTIIQNYLNATEKYNYAFFIGDVAYRLYIGYNYSTKQQQNAEGNWFTVPYQMTSIYGFIVNLEDLSIYKTFQNTDSWTFTDNGFGNLLTYEYSIKSDCLVLLCDMDGWGSTGGAYMAITTIKAGTGVRSTKYFTVNYSGDYRFKSITYTSYDYDQDCYYLAYHTFQSSSEGGRGSTKRICKITPTGSLSSIYESSEDMSYIYSLWTSYFKNINSLFCYYTSSKGMCLRNLANGREIRLYGSTIYNSSYFGLDTENIYFSHKLNESDTEYNIYRVNMTTLEAEIIPDTASSSRISNAFYTYNRELCVYYNNKIISLNGEFLANFMKAMLNNPNISGIDKINDYIYKASFADYNLQISADRFTAKLPTYTYFDYSNITSFPITNDLCMITPNKNSAVRNDDSGCYKYQSLVITDVARSNEELYARIEELENQLSEANGIADIIRGE